jgi:hypothetical protein
VRDPYPVRRRTNKLYLHRDANTPVAMPISMSATSSPSYNRQIAQLDRVSSDIRERSGRVQPSFNPTVCAFSKLLSILIGLVRCVSEC